MRRPSLFAAIIFFLAGTGVYVGGIFSLTQAFLLSHQGVRVQGTVLADVQKTSTDKYGNPQVLHHAQVQFAGQDGQIYSFVSDMGTGSFGYRIGQAVPVIYSTAHPDQAHIDDFMNTWLVPIILVVLSVFPLMVSAMSIQGLLTGSSVGI